MSTTTPIQPAETPAPTPAPLPDTTSDEAADLSAQLKSAWSQVETHESAVARILALAVKKSSECALLERNLHTSRIAAAEAWLASQSGWQRLTAVADRLGAEHALALDAMRLLVEHRRLDACKLAGLAQAEVLRLVSRSVARMAQADLDETVRELTPTALQQGAVVLPADARCRRLQNVADALGVEAHRLAEQIEADPSKFSPGAARQIIAREFFRAGVSIQIEEGKENKNERK